MASMAANFRSACASERGAPECSTQHSPGGTPQVGHGTEDICLGVSSFFFIGTECDNAHPRNRPVLDIVRITATPSGWRFCAVLYSRRNDSMRGTPPSCFLSPEPSGRPLVADPCRYLDLLRPSIPWKYAHPLG